MTRCFCYNQKIISRCGCFFHPDHPPVTYQVEIGKVVEKDDVEVWGHIGGIYGFISHPVTKL